MRKLLLTTAAICLAGCSKSPAPKSVSATPDTAAVSVNTLPITYDTFTDTRDGQTYKIVKMPDGKTWMAQNLNYRTDSGSWCYNDSLSYCKKYGRLYEWDVAIKACPTGYHLPFHEEWGDLARAAGGTGEYGNKGPAGIKLKAKSGWKKSKKYIRTDDYGFSALPGGVYASMPGKFGGASGRGYWWTATEFGIDLAYGRSMYYNYDYVDGYLGDKIYGFSVRCVADSP